MSSCAVRGPFECPETVPGPFECVRRPFGERLGAVRDVRRPFGDKKNLKNLGDTWTPKAYLQFPAFNMKKQII